MSLFPIQVAEAIADGKASVKVICEDTDVFALLCHCYYKQGWDINLFMEGFSPGKSLICIKQTVKRHEDLMPSLLSTHALSGSDTVPMMFGIGKKKVIDVSKKLPLVRRLKDHFKTSTFAISSTNRSSIRVKHMACTISKNDSGIMSRK